MKKKLLIALLAIIATLGLAVGLAACSKSDDGNGPGSTHEHVHALTHYTASEATCTESGNIEYWYCAECGEYFSDADATNEIEEENIVIPVIDHTAGEVETEKEVEATCTKDGSYDEVVYCTVCGEEISRETKIIAATGHSYSEWEAVDEKTHKSECEVCNIISYGTHNFINRTCTVCGLAFDYTPGLSYTLSEDETYYIVSGIRTTSDTEIIIPSEYNGLPVTEIGNYVFQNYTYFESITIPDSVISIGQFAFNGCTAEIIWGNNPSITEIGDYVFYGYAGTSITIPDSVTTISSYAFSGCASLESITIGSSVTNIGYAAFSGCTAEILWGDTPAITEIGRAFAGYAGTSIIIPASVTSIGSSAFSGCSSLTSITIPASVTSIGSSAFSGCSSLTSITIPDSVTSIGDYTFRGCTSLTSIAIPDSVTSIGSSAFSDCTAEILWGDTPAITEIGSYAFANYAGANITIPDTISSIGEFAFYNCTALTAINYNATACNDLGSNNLVFYSAGTNGNGITVTIGANVEKIPAYLFYPSSYSPKIVSVMFEESSKCTSIGSYAFYNCTSLESIVVPDSVISIGARAFYNCTAEIIWGDNPAITEIGSYAFANYVGTSITIPDSVVYIGSYAFAYCTSLTSIIIPDSVISIGRDAFSLCTSLASIIIGSSVETIDSYAFYNCTALTEIYYNATACNDLGSNNLVFYSAGTNGNGITVTIGANVEKIPAYLFCSYYNSSLYWPNNIIKVTFEDNSQCTSIGNYAFFGCSLLTSITIPDSVTSIGELAFNGCRQLVEVYNLSSLSITAGSTSNGYVAYYALNVYTTKGANKLSTTEDGFIIYADNETEEYYLIGYVGNSPNITLLENINGQNYKIYQYAFYNNTSLTSIAIPASVISIGEYAFYNCTSLASITIPDSVTSIGWGAFDSCTSLTSITIPDSVTSIGDYTFSGCTSLTSIAIPDSVISIGEYAFSNCTSLTSITIPDSVTSIGDYTFSGCTSLTSIAIPDSVISIGEYAFYNCTSLASITIGSSVETIGNRAFYKCTSLTNIAIPDSVISIGWGAFDSCTSLTSITIPDSVTSIGSSAFSGCTSLTSIAIPDSVTSIGWGAFDSCTSLTSITIGSSVETIGNGAFYNCTSLENIYVNEDNAYYCDIDGVLFNKDVTILVSYPAAKPDLSYTVPDSVETIGNLAFSNCTSLTSIIITDSVTSIGSSAFSGCTSLTSVTFENTEGWWYASSSTDTSGTSISNTDLSAPSTAATYLTDTYVSYYWKRS